MEKYDIVIIGAGASGLMAANELSIQGFTCCILEAAPGAGGRIATIFDSPESHTENGAEFIHGQLPLTFQLLNEAGIAYTPVTGEMISIRNGKQLSKQEPYHEQFIKKANDLSNDINLSEFLNQYFSGDKASDLRKSVQHFSEGFDLADPKKVSVFALRAEWSHEDDKQYRVKGGYGMLVNYLLDKCRANKTTIHFNSLVSEVSCNENGVAILAGNGNLYTAGKLIVTASAGVLQNRMIKFSPQPEEHLKAMDQLGFGAVIKILLLFKNNFWHDLYPNAGFFLSDEEIPTWWTQLPAKSNWLTGWLGGPAASAKSSSGESSLLQTAVTSLSRVFRLDEKEITADLNSYKIIPWENNSFVKGGYSYTVVGSVAARDILSRPFSEKIFFAGEATWNGSSQGTVEAALQSGLAVSNTIMTLAK